MPLRHTSRFTKYTSNRFGCSITITRLKPKERTMQEITHQLRKARASSEIEREAKMKLTLDYLQTENGRLKALVVRLSETIIRNVVTQR